MKSLPFGLADLSVAERVELVEDLWDSIAASSEALPVTDAQKAELDRRLKSHDTQPDAGTSWTDIAKHLRRSK